MRVAGNALGRLIVQERESLSLSLTLQANCTKPCALIVVVVKELITGKALLGMTGAGPAGELLLEVPPPQAFSKITVNTNTNFFNIQT